LSINVIAETATAILIILGSIACLFSAVGMLRFPDFYNRSHGASKTTALGVFFVLLGTFLFFSLTDKFISIRLLLGISFVFLTFPVGTHMVFRAAYRTGVELWEETVQDDLKNLQDKLRSFSGK
jgi:multicomponent Na+:H+ antiporter subunit G